MKMQFKEISGSICAPIGFMAGGVFCDIRKLGTGKGSNKGQKRDLALIVSEVPATVAGMFTTNQICAAPVRICVERAKKGIAQAIVVNSGNANACTGRQGLHDAKAMTEIAAHELKISAQKIFLGSTGRIGVALPMENVKRGILEAAELLGDEIENADAAAEAIMTSDTRPKQIAIEFLLGGKTVRIGGICKGAGMIQPGMSTNGKRPAALSNGGRPQGLHATMLCFITTDAAIDSKILQTTLNEAVAQSFNRITVDGDMSTNDTVLVLANGLAENKKLVGRASPRASSSVALPHRDLKIFQNALNHVCLELAKMIVRDGEG
ncbi:MAG: bifunctional ornithine acetyltransferase/N-acetylglutamate synthase, partial [Limisphaerales bacterium]